MSSRANASARARRAGETSQPQQVRPQQPQPQQQQQQMQQQRMQQTKLSIPDAIGLTTLRLGKLENHFSVLEQIVQNLSSSGVGVEGGESFNEIVRVVDEAVFQSIVTRLENLEKRQSHQQQQPQQVQSQPQQKITPQVNADVEAVKQDLNTLKNEMSNLKDLLLSLQSFTMQTNQKLADIVFQENIFVDEDIVNKQKLEFDMTQNNDENEFADDDELCVSQNIIGDS
jgi:hypothetical protein